MTLKQFIKENKEELDRAIIGSKVLLTADQLRKIINNAVAS